MALEIKDRGNIVAIEVIPISHGGSLPVSIHDTLVPMIRSIICIRT